MELQWRRPQSELLSWRQRQECWLAQRSQEPQRRAGRLTRSWGRQWCLTLVVLRTAACSDHQMRILQTQSKSQYCHSKHCLLTGGIRDWKGYAGLADLVQGGAQHSAEEVICRSSAPVG